MKDQRGIRRAAAYESLLVGTLVVAAGNNQRWPLPVYVALGVLLLVASVSVVDAIGGAALILPIVPFGAIAAYVLATTTGTAQYVGIGLINLGLVWPGCESLIVIGLVRRSRCRFRMSASSAQVEQCASRRTFLVVSSPKQRSPRFSREP